MVLTGQTVALSRVGGTVAAAVATAVVLKSLHWLYKCGSYVAFFKSLPGETSFSWIWGNLHKIKDMSEEERLQYFEELTVKNPKFFRFFMGPFRARISLHHPDTVRAILKQAGRKSWVYDMILPWLGEGLLVAHGEKWWRSRRLLTPAFHFDILKPYNNISNRACDQLLEKVARGTSGNKSLEMFSCVSQCTLDVILQCAMGYKDDIQSKGEDNPYVHAVVGMSDLLTKRIRNPLVHEDWIYALTSNGRKNRQLCAYVHSVAEDVIKARQHSLETEGPPKKRHLDFLDILLTARDEQGKGLTPLEIRSEVDTFLFEGHDTTASAVSWTLYSMCENPDCQAKVQEEVDDILQGRESDDIEWDDLGKMEYTAMCIKEAMRLHCPVPGVSRCLTEPLTVEGITLPAGTLCGISIINLHHNPTVWPEPLAFNPERFEPDNCKGRDNYAYIPFSAGPRNCIGQHFAMNEMKVMVGRLLRRFTFTLDPSLKVAKSMAMIMRTQNGMKMFATPRNVAA